MTVDVDDIDADVRGAKDGPVAQAAAPSERNPIGWAGLALAAAGLAYLLWTNL